jgi:hypothetical protein
MKKAARKTSAEMNRSGTNSCGVFNTAHRFLALHYISETAPHPTPQF